MAKSSTAPSAINESSSASPSYEAPKLLRLHESSIGISTPRSMQDRARGALAKVRALCFRATMAGLKHDDIADSIGVPARTLSSYKAGTTVPHTVVDALESLVLRVEKRVGK